jgi:hypothetical protein
MPTDKRLKHLARQAAKLNNTFSREERQAEYDKVSTQFASLGLSEESFEEIKRFMDIARDWLETGTAYQGAIPIIGIDRQIVYTLPNNKRHQVGVMLQSTKPNTTMTNQNVVGENTDSTEAPEASPVAPTTQPKKKSAPIVSGPRHARAAYRAPPTKVKAQSA